MYQIKQIYDKYADEVSRFQYRNFNPVSTLNLNEENKNTTFKIDIEDDFIDKNIEYYIEGKITPTDAKNIYSSKSNIKLVNNFVAHLFPQIEVKKQCYYRWDRLYGYRQHNQRLCVLSWSRRI